MADDAFQETTEGVKAKLDVQVPEQALTTLAALSKQMESFRISMEAASRAQGDHLGYLEKMPSISDLATSKLKEWCDQVERAVDLKGKLGDLGGIPGAVGQDSANPFGSAVLGRGELGNLLNPMAQHDPSRIVSMGAQRGLVDKSAVGGMTDEQIKKLADALTGAVGGETPNDGAGGGGGGGRPTRPGQRKKHDPEEDEGLSPQRLEQGAIKGRDLIGNVLGEMGPGKSFGDAIGAGRDALGGLEGMGGMVGKVAGALGPVGAGVGLALTANQLLQMGGQQFQKYKSLGIETGEGAGKGFEYDVKAKMLALDPFITTAQAREVIQGSLNAGMGGDSFDSVTGFIAKNLKDMNLAVADSVKLLQTNVEKGGMSIDQLGTSLSNVTAMAKGAAQGQGQLMQNFGANTQSLTNLGISGPQGQIAEQFMGAFKDSPLLSSVGDQVIQQALGNPVFATQIGMEASREGIPGITGTPTMVIQKLARSGKLSDVVWKRLATIAQQAKASSRDPDQQLAQFVSQVNSIGLPIGQNEARGLMDQLTQPGGLEKAIAQGKEANQAGAKPQDTGTGEQVTSDFVALGGHIKNIIGEGVNVLGDLFTGNWGAISGDIDATQKRKEQIGREHDAAAAPYTTETLRRAVTQYGTDQLQVYDSQGKNPTKLDQYNKEQRDKLSSGELLIAPKGGQPQKLSEFGSSQAAGAAAGGGNVNVTASPLTVKYEGPISGPSAVPLTANQMQTNTGYGGATNNNVPPGNR